MPILGSSHIQLKTKLMLAQSLILSRALCAVAAWRGQLEKGWQPLGAQYHSVPRRINGTMRFGAPDTITDAVVREAMAAPSLHSLVRAHRLAGLCSQLSVPALVVNRLSAIPKPPSAFELLQDLRNIQRFHCDRLAVLGDPYAFPGE